MATFTLAPGDLWDNGYSTDQGDYYQSSPLARAKFTTSARLATIVVVTDILGSSQGEIGVRVNGSDWWWCPAMANGTATLKCLLPRGANKTVEIFAGLQNKPSDLLGTYLVSVEFEAAANLVTPSGADRIVVYGDSISVGASASPGCLKGWTGILKATRNVLVEGWGYRKLQDDGSTAGARTTFANLIAAYTPSIVWLAIGTNDYALIGSWNAASFGTAYADLLDKLNTALPSAVIYCQTPITRTGEGANGAGSTMAEYRTAISDAVSTRTAYATLVDGTAWTIPLADGVHPTSAGHAEYAAQVEVVLSA